MTPVEGEQVDYHSTSYRSWIPAVVVHVDPETGAVQLNVKQHPLSLQDQQVVLRPRTKPEKAQLEWTRAVLREGRIEQEARALFQRHAKVEQGAAGEPVAFVRQEAFHGLGCDIDQLLGVSGCVVQLCMEVQQMERRAFTVDDFTGVFWSLLSGVQHEYGSALPRHDQMYRREDPRNVYEFTRTLGKGTYGHVKLALEKRTGSKRAIKIISKKRMSVALEQLQMEIEHLCLLDHPHIVKLYEYFDDGEYVYLVTDFCSGGELQQAIYHKSLTGLKYPESVVADTMRQLLMAVAHIHARGIVHLDIKSANIMIMPSKRTLMPVDTVVDTTLEQDFEKPHVVLIDLGVAQLFHPGNFSHNKPMGTPATMAPEVWRGVITPKADVFSCGVVLYELLSFRYPLNVPGDRENGPKFWHSAPQIDFGRLQPASQGADQLCRCMMVIDRQQRPTAAQCLTFLFLQDDVEDPVSLTEPAAAAKVPPEIIRRLVKLPERSVLYKSIALSIARVWPANRMPTIKRAFQELSTACSGPLDVAQVSAFLQSLGVSQSRAQRAADAMDLDRDGTVDFTEFVAACTYLGSDEFEKTLWEIFQEADSDDDNLLSQSDISKLLPVDHEGEVVRDVFHGLTGRTEPGARVDWPTFRRHFKSQSLPLDGEEPGAGAGKDATAKPWGGLEQAFDFVEKVRQGILAAAAPAPAPRPQEPARTEVQEQDLRRLAEMGFHNREQCVAVLQRHRNELSNSAVEELVRK